VFVLSPKNLEVFWPVTIAVPMDGGEVEEFTFECKFKVLNTDEFQDKYPAFAANINDIKDLPARERAFWSDVVTDWRQVSDEKGKELKFTKARFEQLLKKPYTARALHKAYQDCLAGRKSKN
tara:strand:+ start:704 stop:1069 length:366 start_codon:yes stop_codon:yes gene_type:complete